MKKFAAGILAVSMLVLLVFALNGGFDDVDPNEINGMHEASFSMPVTGASSVDASGFLVGEYDCEDGGHMSFDGLGGVKVRDASGMVHSGRYSLMQNADRSAVLTLTFSDSVEIYAFEQLSAEGDFSLTPANGGSRSYKPVIIG